MSVNNDMHYTTSTEVKAKLLEEAENKIFTKLSNKAQRLLGSKDYQLGVPQNIIYSEQDPDNTIRPIARSYYNENVINAGQSQMYRAAEISIQPPSEFEIIVSMSGNFEVIKKAHTPKP